MPWLKIDDGFAEHEKILDLADRAFRVHLAALCQCAKNLTDGYVDAKRVKIIGAIIGKPITGSVNELVTAGLWAADGDGYQINDYLDYNPSAEKVKKERAKSSERQARWRAKSRGNDAEELDYESIAERDQWQCYLCGSPVSVRDWSFDHVVPLEHGGAHTNENVRLCHARCNKRKGTRNAPGNAVTDSVTDDVGNAGVSRITGDGAPSRPVLQEPHLRAVSPPKDGTAPDLDLDSITPNLREIT